MTAVLNSTLGMSMGGVRHIADIKTDDMSKDSHAIINLQSGSNKGASQVCSVLKPKKDKRGVTSFRKTKFCQSKVKI